MTSGFRAIFRAGRMKAMVFVLPALFSATIFAQNQYIQIDDSYSAQQLVDVLVDNSCAQFSNVTVQGSTSAQGGISYGYFTAGASFPFQSGIILTTGYAGSAQGPNTNILSDGLNNWGGDNDLEAALGNVNTLNATSLEFDFIPATGNISFDFMFSSEEYTSWTSLDLCNFSDGFAFLLKEAGSDEPYQNLAVIPGTDVPVAVTTVRGPGFCPSANESFFGGFNNASHPTNFNGQTVVMTAQADVTPGVTYHIKLVIADQGDSQYDSAIFLGADSFDSAVDLGTDRLFATNNPLCDGETITLNATNPLAQGYQWMRDNNPIAGATGPVYTVTTAGTYSLELQLTSTCFAEGKITVEYAPVAPSGSYTLLQCDEDNNGLAIFNLTTADDLVTAGLSGLVATYYLTIEDAEAALNPISNISQFANTVIDQNVYARVVNEYNCYSVSTVRLSTSSNTVTSPSLLTTCDTDGTDDGFFVFDLTSINDEILQALPPGLLLQYYTSLPDAYLAVNAIADPSAYVNATASNDIVYARIFNGSECYGIAEVNLVVYSFGPGFEDEEVTLCTGTIEHLSVAPDYASYSWNTNPPQATADIMVSRAGNYTVTVTDVNGCQAIKTFIVVPSGPPTAAFFEINDFAGNSNSINVLAQGPGDYEYSLDGITYQDDTVFGPLAAGEYIVYIKDKNGCAPVYTDIIYVLDYPKFFTPNNDGINDIWNIAYLSQYPNTIVTIYDRYGKSVAAFKGNVQGWDGTLKGKRLPATDYWFMIQMENGRTIKGHFAMMR